MTMDEARPTIFGSPFEVSTAPCPSSLVMLRGDERFRTVSVVANARATSQTDDALSSNHSSFPPRTPMAVTFVVLRRTLGRMSFPETH